MRKNLTERDITPALKSAVRAYLLAKAYADTMREAVDKIERAVLEECPLTNTFDRKHGRSDRERRITDPKMVYLCTDDDLLRDYYDECDKREREAKLKPPEMERDHCPALVAESLQREAASLVVDCGAEMMDADKGETSFRDLLLCAGLEKYHQFVELCVRLVVNLPDFKNPMAA